MSSPVVNPLPDVGLPDVAVVVIAFNDAANLPHAVDSVLRQTLRNLEVIVVDDASTDGTGEMADRLAAGDQRVRAVHLDENSGGCSRPRNVGLEHARGPYVMFLDSDDVYERHACKNLLLEAERTGADVVSGLCMRVLLDRHRNSAWQTELYEQHATFAGVRAKPELFFDPLSTNKLYLRSFLEDGDIRFPEGVHYEDSLFTTKVYCQAKTIAVIPNLVYYWRVLRDAPAKSISQRRQEIDNFRNRIAVHRMMDDYLTGQGSGDLKVYKDFKFVRHDLRLYLNDLPARDVDYQQRFVELAADYLATVSEQTLQMIEPVERICVSMLMRLDVEETIKTVDYLRHDYKLSTRLVERDGRIYWSDKYLDTAQDRAVMDVTDMGLHRVSFDRKSIFNEVTKAEMAGGHLRMAGRLLNQFGQIAPDDPLQLTVVVRNRARHITSRRFPATVLRHEGPFIYYSTDVDLARGVRPLDQLVRVWEMRLEVVWRGQANLTTFSIEPAAVAGRRIRLRARFGGLARGTLEPYVTIKGNLAFEQVVDEGVSEATGAAHTFLQRALHSYRWRSKKAVVGKRRAYRWFQRLPVKRGLTVFESHMGKQFSDNPKYVYEAMRRIGFDRLCSTPVWSYAETPDSFPADAATVLRNSWRYYYLMARAEYWVDNQGFPKVFTKRPEATYLQTWHGTPLKTMGWDEPALAALSPASRATRQRGVDRWDYLVAPSEYFVETFVRSYNCHAKLLRVGYPRNDLLVNRGDDGECITETKNRLGIPLDRTIVLYAPTFRERDRERVRRDDRAPDEEDELAFDIAELAGAVGEDCYLLVRMHYLDEFTLSRRHAPFAMDVSEHDDVTELLLVADVLVTDYSSTMFDFANTGRPMIFYTYDYDEYVQSERGTYFSLAEEAPGPLVTTTQGLADALRNLDGVQRDNAERYARWRRRFCEYDDGHAADHVVRTVFGSGERP